MAIATIFGTIFDSDILDYLPFLAVSLVLWTFIVGVLNDATGAFPQSERIMKQVWIPVSLPVIRIFARHTIIFFHNLVVAGIVLLVMGKNPGLMVFMAIPGLVISGSALLFLSGVIAIIGARFRDLGPIVSSVLMVSFYVTPIIWMPDALPEQVRNLVVIWNPFFHLMEIFRGPLLGTLPPLVTWVGALAILLISAILARIVFRRFSARVVYWL